VKGDFIHLMMCNDYCQMKKNYCSHNDMDNILVNMDVWFGSTHEQILVKFEMWDLNYPAHCPRNLPQSMTSYFSPFPIFFDDPAPSLSSDSAFTFYLYLLLPSHNLQSSLCSYLQSASQGERTGIVECTFEERYRFPFLSQGFNFSIRMRFHWMLWMDSTDWGVIISYDRLLDN
jgi:hypothetical protein